MKRVTFVLLSLFLFTSCKREKTEDPAIAETETKDTWTPYYPKTDGSYWIYEVAIINTKSPQESHPITDSIISAGDTSLWGNTYKGFSVFRKERNQPYKYLTRNWVRDSSGYLVRPLGYMVFSEYDRTSELYTRAFMASNDTLAYVSYSMNKPDTAVQVPAGTFTDLLNFQGSYFRNKRPGFVEATVKIDNIYAREVGLIYSSTPFDISDDMLLVTRLVRYHIE